MTPFHPSPRLAIHALSVALLACCLVTFARADLIVTRGSGGTYDPTISRYSATDGSARGTSTSNNEGWQGLCRGPEGRLYAVTNILGAATIYAFAADGTRDRIFSDATYQAPQGIAFGPDGNLYAVGIIEGSYDNNPVLGVTRIDGINGQRVANVFLASIAGATWLDVPRFGPDGKLYLLSDLGVLRVDPASGAYLGVVVALGSGGLDRPAGLAFTAAGDLLVGSSTQNSIKRYAGSNGAYLGDFVAAGSGGLSQPTDLTFGPDGDLYVASYGSGQVLRYRGATGAFVSIFVANSGALPPHLLVFDGPVTASETVWFDDALPAGAVARTTGGDSWTWVTDNPVSGTKAFQTILSPDLHEQFFAWAQPLTLAAGDRLFAWVFLADTGPQRPRELMLSWFDGGNWEHRAYWGENLIAFGQNGTESRRYLGPVPSTQHGQWMRLEIPVESVGLAGKSVSGMSFSVYGGQVKWDRVGKVAYPAPATPPTVSNPPPSNPPATTTGTTTVWFDDAWPAGAQTGTTGGAWTRAAGTPPPKFGANALYSNLANGLHEQWLNFAWDGLALAANDTFYIWVYLDPANPPRELCISFCADNWNHRAYWGQKLMNYATDGTPAQYRIGDLPAAGQWVRLEVPAARVNLAGQTVTGLSLTLYDGKAAFDQAGKISP